MTYKELVAVYRSSFPSTLKINHTAEECGVKNISFNEKVLLYKLKKHGKSADRCALHIAKFRKSYPDTKLSEVTKAHLIVAGVRHHKQRGYYMYPAGNGEYGYYK